MEDEKVESCVGVAEKGKRINGVSRRNNRWRARVRHPILKYDITLGCFSSPEEAAVAVKKKKAEFDEMFKLRDSLSVDTNDDNFWEMKLPPGVSRSGYSRWGARVWNPELRHSVSLGTFGSPEEAAAAVNEKRAEFRNMYGSAEEDGPKCKDVDDVVEQPECGELRTSEWLDECSTVKLPRGVRKIKSGKWVARIRDPESKASVWLGTYNTCDEAVTAFNEKKAVFAAKRKRVEFDERIERKTNSSFGSEAIDYPEEPECELGYENVTSALGSENLNSSVVNDNLNYGVVVDTADKRQNKCVYNSPTSVLKSGILNGGYGSNESQTREVVVFDRLVGWPRNKLIREKRLSLKRGVTSLDQKNVTVETSVELEPRCKGVDVVLEEKPECGFLSTSDCLDNELQNRIAFIFPTSVSKPLVSNGGFLSDQNDCREDTQSSSFDEAMSLGFINEYGQLLGKYSFLDEQMELCLPAEDVALAGVY